MNFGKAVELLKDGQCVSRGMWKGTDKLFIFKQVPAEINKDIVPKMQSLPDSVKKQFQGTFESECLQLNAIYYSCQLALVCLSNVIHSYAASAEDIFADDWCIYE